MAFSKEYLKEMNELIERHEPFLKAFTAGTGVSFRVGDVETSYFDPEKMEIVLSPNRLVQAKEKGVPSGLEGLGSFFHEIGHLMHLLREPDVFLDSWDRIKNKEEFVLYNVCDDIQVEEALKQFKPIREAREAVLKVQPTSRMLSAQFLEALAYNAMFNEVPKGLDLKVESALKELRDKSGVDLIDLLKKTPETSLRHPLIEKYFKPVFKKFLNEDEKKFGGEVVKKELVSISGGKEAPFGLSREDMKKIALKFKSESVEEKAKRMTLEAEGVKEEQAADYNEDFRQVEPYVKQLAGELRNIVDEHIVLNRAPGELSTRGNVLEPGVFPTALVKIKQNLPPQVFRKIEPRVKSTAYYPKEVLLAMVCDMSKSMEREDKAKLQRQAAVLLMEGVDDYNKSLAEKRQKLGLPNAGFEIKTWIRRFGEEDNEIKPPGVELSLKTKVNAHARLSNPSEGNTLEHLSLQEILNFIDSLPASERSQFKTGERKLVTLVLTDGKSGDPYSTKNVLKELKERGVEVWGVGITRQANVDNYEHHIVIANPGELPPKIGELIKERIKKSIKKAY